MNARAVAKERRKVDGKARVSPPGEETREVRMRIPVPVLAQLDFICAAWSVCRAEAIELMLGKIPGVPKR